MGISFDEKAFERIKKKILNQSLSGNDENLSEIANAIADRGIEIATEKYASSGENVELSKSQNENGSVSILAKSDQIAYIEFGTGREGENSPYLGELPSSGIPITNRWVYFYEMEGIDHKTTDENGREGWWYGGEFQIGRPAGNQLWETVQQLEAEKASIAHSEMKGK